MNYGMQGQQHPEHMTNSRQNKQTNKHTNSVSQLAYLYNVLRVCTLTLH